MHQMRTHHGVTEMCHIRRFERKRWPWRGMDLFLQKSTEKPGLASTWGRPKWLDGRSEAYLTSAPVGATDNSGRGGGTERFDGSVAPRGAYVIEGHRGPRARVARPGLLSTAPTGAGSGRLFKRMFAERTLHVFLACSDQSDRRAQRGFPNCPPTRGRMAEGLIMYPVTLPLHSLCHDRD